MKYLLLLALLSAPPAAGDSDQPPKVPEKEMVNQIAKVSDNVPDDQKLAKGSELIDIMRSVLTKVLEHLKDAREEKDIVKLNCVEDKLIQVRGLLKISEDAYNNLQETLVRKEKNKSAHEYSKISVARQKVEQLLAESEACVGELAVYSGKTEVEVEILEKNIMVEDEEVTTLAKYLSQLDDIITRPPSSSPNQ